MVILLEASFPSSQTPTAPLRLARLESRRVVEGRREPASRRSRRSVARLVDLERTTLQIGTVEASDRFGYDRCVAEFHEREPTRLPGGPIDRKEHFVYLADLGEHCFQLRLGGAEWQITDEDLCRDNVLLVNE